MLFSLRGWVNGVLLGVVDSSDKSARYDVVANVWLVRVLPFERASVVLGYDITLSMSVHVECIVTAYFQIYS